MKQAALFIQVIAVFMITNVLLVVWDNTTAALAASSALEQKLYEAAKKEGKLVWWDTLSLKEATVFIDKFNKKYPEIKVSYFESTNETIADKYFTEHAAGVHNADVLRMEVYKRFKEKNLLLDLSDIIRDTGFSKKFCSNDFDAVGVEHTLKVAAYNSKLITLQDLPRSWEDLLDPKWQGKIAMEDRMKYFIFGTNYWGEEKLVDYLKKLSKQNPTFSNGSSAMMTLLAAGEFPFVIGVNFHQILAMQAKGGQVAWSRLSPIIDNMSTVIVMRYAPHPNSAKLFLHWYMSKEGELLTDQLRHKGNPLPGSGTLTSKILGEKGNPEIVLFFPWDEIDHGALEKKYQQAIGYLKTKSQKK